MKGLVNYVTAVMAIVVLGGCATSSPPLDETMLGAPLPYDPEFPELRPALPLDAIPPRVLNNGPRKRKWIALTFDACSTQSPGKFDDQVIRALIKLKVPATLFLGGQWMEEHPDETMELANYPQFELANHTYHHPHLTRESDVRVREEIQRTQDILFTLTGQTARLFRAPYGEIDPRVARLVGEQGLVSVQFDLASGDPDPKIPWKKLADYVIKRSRNGSIVVMHMNGRGWQTANALPRIILRLRKEGYEFKTVSQLFEGIKKPKPSKSAGG